MVLTVTKKVRKVKEEIVELFPVFSSQIPPPLELFPISGWRGGGKPLASTNFSATREIAGEGGFPKSPR